MNSIGVSKMTLPTPHESKSTHEGADLLLRASRRALLIVLLMIFAFGATLLGRLLWPESALAMWPARLPWLLPVLVVLGLVAMRFSLQGRSWGANNREVKILQEDEFRRTNLSRAQRAALIVVLALQIPLGLLYAYLPSMRAVMAMGVTTITLAMATLITCFLFFDRD
jgi:hypothetical protein